MKRCLMAAVIVCGALMPLAATATSSQEVSSIQEVPLERCDRLPVIIVRIDGADMRFLLDTGATSILNLKSFSSGHSKQITVSSWSGTAATSAREVSIPELILGNHHVRNLKLPAIDLSPIGKACGGRIDGILGIDLLDKLGARIDLKRQVAILDASAEDAQSAFAVMTTAMHPCEDAFTTGNAQVLEECFDPDIVLYTPWGEFRGRKQVMDYLQKRFLQFTPKFHFHTKPQDIRLLGDALWYSYDYEIDSAKEHIAERGMAICRRSNGRWRILNMHNSLRQPDSASN
jgi:hypothetical protein